MGKVGPAADGEDRSEAVTVPAGDYLVVLAYFRHKTSERTGNTYLSCKWDVIAGPFRGKGFWAMMGLDLGNEYTVKSWEGYLTACGLKQAIELDGNEGVRNLNQYCRGVPVKMAVKNKPFNGRQANEVAFCHWPSKLTEADKNAMSAWQNKEEPAEDRPDPTPTQEVMLTSNDSTGDDADDISF